MIEPIVRVRIELNGFLPKIWRGVDVPLDATLEDLHRIIQAAMGWRDYHLYEFMGGGRSYGECSGKGDVGQEAIDAGSIRLRELVARGINHFSYTYDFGDDWEHSVSFGVVRAGKAKIDYPAFVDGAGRCPPEDSGGHYRYMEFLEAILDPSHKHHEKTKAWHRDCYSKDFDPDDIEVEQVRAALARLARLRR